MMCGFVSLWLEADETDQPRWRQLSPRTAAIAGDEWAGFVQLAWTDARTTSGSWRVPRDFSGVPGSNNSKVLETGAKAVGYKNVHTGRTAINSAPRNAEVPASCSAFASKAAKPSPRG